MSELNEHIFDPQLRDYESQIIDFFIKEGEIRNRGKKAQLIYAYLLIHRQLTQNQLAELSNLSKGYISSALSSMQNIQLINRKMIPGTHTYKYSFLNDNNFFGFRESSKLVQYYNNFERVVWSEIKKLENLKCEEKSQKRFLITRMKDLIRWTQAVTKIICEQEGYKNPNADKYPNLLNTQLYNSNNELEFFDYEPNLVEFEKNFIDIILSMDNTFRKDPILILEGFFLTRKILSQQKIEELSQYSRATISKSISKMLKMGEIQKIPKSNALISGYKAYIMPNVTEVQLLMQISTQEQILTFQPAIKKIIVELKTNKKKLDRLNGYTEIQDITSKLEEYFSHHEQKLKITKKIYHEIKDIQILTH
ncbi:hypothetical protein [Candidatus Lokiarchaeum ossiferum]|uniref:hypothetical protein n=1 Tax=Candidatus Lokiarchaeum ossiferum TaxID=2951803 RepID=UPI00352C5899